MDYIHLNEMEFYGYHGVLPEETKLGQRFRLTVSLATDLSTAGKTDDLKETVNYATVHTICQEIVEGTPMRLIEAVAEKVAESLMEQFTGKVFGVRVLVVKPNPPIAGHYNSVAVDITRGHFL